MIFSIALLTHRLYYKIFFNYFYTFPPEYRYESVIMRLAYDRLYFNHNNKFVQPVKIDHLWQIPLSFIKLIRAVVPKWWVQTLE